MLRALLTLRCPKCRRGALFSGILELPERCAECGLLFEREHGYFAGAMAISYGLAILLLAVLFFGLLAITRLSLEWVLLASAVLFLPLAPLCVRYSRAIWIYLDRRMDPHDRGDLDRF